MITQKNIIIDFDSTFVSVEALDELARLTLRGTVDQEARVIAIAQITKDGMEGSIGFGDSLLRRLALFRPKQHHINELVSLLLEHVTTSVAEQRDFLVENANHIYIVSGGFHEYIVPVVKEYGIAADHVMANTFTWSAKGVVDGLDKRNPMSLDRGKVKVLSSLALTGYSVMVGDGYSDYQAREAGVVDEFVALVENIDRKPVTERADHVAHSFDEVIRLLALSDTIVA